MKILIIDLETGGLSCKYHPILTIGLVAVEYKESGGFTVLGTEELAVKHEKYNCQPMALKINGINIQEHDKVALSHNEIKLRIRKFIARTGTKGAPLMGQNHINFDIPFLRKFYEEEKLPFSRYYIDLMNLWITMKHSGLIPWKFNNKLQSMANFFNIDYSKAHNARDDCLITLNVYDHILRLINKDENISKQIP